MSPHQRHYLLIMARSTEPNPKSSAGDWSVVVNGLSGRLLVQFEDLNPGLRHTVSLELRNHALKPVAVTNQPKIHAEIFDPVAKPVSTAGFVMDGPILSLNGRWFHRMLILVFALTCRLLVFPLKNTGWLSSQSEVKPGNSGPEGMCST